ncbi:hypothetical protein [Methylobacterium nigriterrae]|uniref:hypothetical protein n=1 Tax=Methylobacterium nigriterrae TaxID=3127512 RepID=UPI0030136E3E
MPDLALALTPIDRQRLTAARDSLQESLAIIDRALDFEGTASPDRPAVGQPIAPGDEIRLSTAAQLLRCSTRHATRIVAAHGLGWRLPNGRWCVSRGRLLKFIGIPDRQTGC